ncbi:short-chain collagen C4-like [Saccostrea cucullata]|uniref:short-chain collagen C4-like n=1 Tax=Saccostrea cuccullata TaxID=36930 RepID=UPI002ED6636E
MRRFFVFFGVVSTLLFCTVSMEQKRLLINDPQFLESRFLAMESKIQSLMTTKAEMESKIQTLTTSNAEMDSKIQTFTTSKAQMESKIQTLATSNSEMDSKIQTLTREVETLKVNNSKVVGGATYVRWGRKTCPDADSELVYWGYTGGSLYNQGGGAAEFVCLPRDPTFHNILSSAFSFMYGSEYESNFVSGIHDDDVPCAVCRSLRSTSVIMLASREHCYSGWKTEYSGFLSSGDTRDSAASQFVCLDRHPDVLDHSSANENGKVFYTVMAKCGSLPCPPYKDGQQLYCSVCSK